MAEILLVNPRKRGSKKKRKKASSTRRRKNPVRKKRRTAAQKRATAKMIAANRRRARGKTRRKNPVRKKRRKKTATKRRRSPVRRRRRRVARRRNPALNMRSIQNQLVEAGTGAVGALGLDVVQGYLPIPANLKGGLVGTGVKALLAIGMGVLASNVRIVRPATAAKMANGALTVVLHDELKKQVQNFAPGIQMGEYIDNGMGYYASGYPAGNIPGLGEYLEDPTMGTYLPELSADGLDMDESGFNAYDVDYMEDLNYG